MSRLVQDLRLALRGFRRTPAFPVTAVTILGVGIGMAVAMFAVFDTVMVQTLPVRDQDRIIVAWPYRVPTTEYGLQHKDIAQLKRESRTMRDIADVAHWGATSAPLLDGDRSVVLNRVLASGNFFDVLGARAHIGRLMRPEDDANGTVNVMVLSYGAWRAQFGADPNIVGRKITEPYERKVYTVIGVAPPGLDYPSGAGYWIPPWRDFAQSSVIAIARLAPGATPAAARAELFAIKRRLSPELDLAGANAFTFTEAVLGDVRPALIVLTAAVALLLVIACVNVGGLLLLRAAGRAREFAVRRALGASYGEIARQLLVESALIGVGGGVLGILCARAALRLLIAVAPQTLPRLDAIQLEGVPAGVAVGVTVVATLLFGVGPSLLAARGNISTSLRLGSRTSTDNRARRRLRQSLVAAQVALALIMLAGAALLARSLERLSRIDLGYRADRLSILSVSWPATKYDSEPKVRDLGDELMARWRTTPGVTSLTPIVVPPLIGDNVFVGRPELEGQTKSESASNPVIPVEAGGVDYFRTMGIPIRRGRGLLESDREASPQIAVVSEAVARRLWPHQDPLGKRMRYWSTDSTEWRTVVGVAGDIRFRSLRDATPTIYIPWRQGNFQMNFAIRTTDDLPGVLPSLRRDAHAVEPGLSLWYAHSMDDLLGAPLAQPRLSAFLLSAFGVVALALAAIGLYGVMASVVREQTRDIGIRLALGATPGRVRGEVLREALIVAAVGAALGIAGALVTSRVLTALLYEVSPGDPIAIVAASALLLGVVALAAYVPARRATKVDPAGALRAE
ncbi:MAG: ABC transporter permease [Gemmatimonadaceae bacterium]